LTSSAPAQTQALAFSIEPPEVFDERFAEQIEPSSSDR
jgi:hypothetical protein